MATVNISYAPLIATDTSVESPYPSAVENITSSGTSQTTTAAASNHSVATVTVAGGNIAIAAGSAPTATTGGILILDGQTRNFGLPPGHKIAVIDA
jgi:hypothetical protein